MRAAIVALLVILLASILKGQETFVNYESGQVHPIRVSRDGSRLFAINTPDARLAVFSLADPDRPVRLRDIPVGLEPVSVTPRTDAVALEIDTPAGAYTLEADWVIAADGARSTVRRALGLDFEGRVFEDRFLIADVRMTADFPSERWFWFDPPFNRDQSALLHQQADNVWRIDLQLGWDADPELERHPDRVIPRIERMLGPDARFELEWTSVYTFQCRRLRAFRSPIELSELAGDLSSAFVLDEGLDLREAVDIAWDLRRVDPGDIQRAALAVEDHITDDGQFVRLPVQQFTDLITTAYG